MERAEIYKCKDSGSKESRCGVEWRAGLFTRIGSLIVKWSCSQRWWESSKGCESLIKTAEEERRRNLRKDEEGKAKEDPYG